jgi:stearoyl-CoA desaturase (delta-9 desaturase)
VSGFGITIGFHRLLSHHAFECSPFQRRLWATLGTSALQGGPVFWVGLPRKHHQFGDKDGDPHSPRHHLLEGHMLWMTRLDSKSAAVLAGLNAKDLRELSKDRYIRYLDPGFGPLLALMLAGILRVAGSVDSAYDWFKAANALLFALTAVPVYLLARRVVSGWWAVLAAGVLLLVGLAGFRVPS